MISAGEHQPLRFFHPNDLNILCQLSIYIHSPAVSNPTLCHHPCLISSSAHQILISYSASCGRSSFSHHLRHRRPPSSFPSSIVPSVFRSPPGQIAAPGKKKIRERRGGKTDRVCAEQGREEAGSKRRWPRRETEAAEGKSDEQV